MSARPSPRSRRMPWLGAAATGLVGLLSMTACAGAAPAAPELPPSGIAFSASPVPASPPVPVTSPTPSHHRSARPKPPTPTPSGTRPTPGVACPGNALRGVYHPYRLTVLGTCLWFRGTVTSIRDEEDGDVHVDVAPALGFGRFLDQDNELYQHGSLVTEIMPGQALPVPSIGERVAVFGTWVHDEDHGWNEIHPIWAVETLDTGTVVYRLPPATAGYGSGSGASGTGSGGTGGGSCSGSQ